jgi:hypothetical protein
VTEDKETKTVNKICDPDKACPGLDPGDPEAKSGTDQYPRVERKSVKIKKISSKIKIISTIVMALALVMLNIFPSATGPWILPLSIFEESLSYDYGFPFAYVESSCFIMLDEEGHVMLDYNYGFILLNVIICSILVFGFYKLINFHTSDKLKKKQNEKP